MSSVLSAEVLSSSYFPLAVLAASLLGSIHCVGMCGGLIATSAQGPRQIATYQLGRLLGYLTLGAGAGAIGARLLELTSRGWISWLATGIFALALVGMGVRVWKGRALHFPMPRALSRFLVQAYRLAAPGADPTRMEKALASGAAGLLTALLPCGWLHAFVLLAVGAGSAWKGAAILALFWAGSVPALSVAAWGGRWFEGRLGRFAPRASAILLILVGMGSIGQRAWHSIHVGEPPQGGSHSCHEP